MTWEIAMAKMMRVFHRTIASAAILVEGFRDGTGTYMTDREWTGVWFSDVPLDSNSGAGGDTVLSVEIPVELFEKYQWVEEEVVKHYREALIPAFLVNAFGPPTAFDETEVIE
jgi:hypothetical protein